MVLKSFRFKQMLFETTHNTEVILIYFDPHPNWLKMAIYDPKIAIL